MPPNTNWNLELPEDLDKTGPIYDLPVLRMRSKMGGSRCYGCQPYDCICWPPIPFVEIGCVSNVIVDTTEITRGDQMAEKWHAQRAALTTAGGQMHG